MSRRYVIFLMFLPLIGFATTAIGSRRDGEGRRNINFDAVIAQHADDLIERGRQTFRFDTFGDEDFWGGTLQLHAAIAGDRLGGVGPGVSPRTALAVGLKVDSDALPQQLVRALKHGRVDLDDPATTVALLRLNAVLGLTGIFDGADHLQSMGIQCALCHSTVDDSLAPGIGRRLDGWANRDLNVGAIVALAPNLQPVANLLGVNDATVRAVLNSWGPGKFDAELFMDGIPFRPDGHSAATLIPPAFGLAGVNLHTWTGWGSVTHWNAFVANLEMHGKGTFYDPRLNDATQFPVAARAGFGNVRNTPDLVTPKLAALHLYQLAIPAPVPPAGTFDVAAAARGEALFKGKAACATCHVPPLFTEPGWNMHTAAEIGIDDFQANRAPDRHYRTSPLRGLWTHTKGGFYHDGRFATLADVADHYNTLHARSDRTRSRRPRGVPEESVASSHTERRRTMKRDTIGVWSRGREDPLPAPFPAGVGVLLRQRVGHFHPAGAASNVVLVLAAQRREVPQQPGSCYGGQHRHSVLCALAAPDDHLVPGEVDVFDAQASTFEKPEAGAVEQQGHEAWRAVESLQDSTDLFASQADRSADWRLGGLRPTAVTERAQRPLEPSSRRYGETGRVPFSKPHSCLASYMGGREDQYKPGNGFARRSGASDGAARRSHPRGREMFDGPSVLIVGVSR